MCKWLGLTLLVMLMCANTAIAAEIRMHKGDCQWVRRHQASADVEYKPGVDVEGREVAGADLNPSPLNDIQDHIRIKLTNDAAKVFGLSVPTLTRNGQKVPMVDTETEIGYITIKNNRAYLNGKPLDSDAQSQLVVLCDHEKGAKAH